MAFALSLRFLTVLFCCSATLLLRAQGTVIDGQNGEPLVGATVLLLPDSAYRITDGQGRFNVNTHTQTVRIQFVGYATTEIQVSSLPLTIRLSPDTRKLQQVVITAFERPETLRETPAAIGVLTSRDLRAFNGSNPAPVLNTVPGVFMQSGALNTNRLTIRGQGTRSRFNTSRVRAYMQDIPLTDGVGETTIEDIDLALLGRMEIIKGPASSLYGSGLGGTLLFYPNRPSEDELPSASLNTMVGDYGLQRNEIMLHLGNSEAVHTLAYVNQASDGFRDNNRFDRTSIAWTGQFSAGASHSLSLLGLFIDQKAFIPSSLSQDDYINSPESAAFTWGNIRGNEAYKRGLLGINLNSHLLDGLEWSNSVFTTFRQAEELTPFNSQRDESSTYGLRSVGRYKRNNWSVQLGVESFNELRDFQTFTNAGRQPGPLNSNQGEVRTYTLGFIQADWSFTQRMKLTAGLSWNDTRYELNDLFFSDSVDLSGTYTFDNQWSPRLAWSLHLDRSTWFVQASRGFSPPTLEETLTPEGALNPEIKPETGWNYELGTRGDVHPSLSYEASVYLMQIENLLVSRRDAQDIIIGRNAGSTRHLGLESSITWRPEVQLRPLVTISYTGSFHRFVEFVDDQNVFDGNELTGVPQHVVQLIGELQPLTALQIRADYRYVSAYPITDANDLYNDDYQLLNIRIDWQIIQASRWKMTAYGGINNLLSERFASQVLINAESFGRAPRYYYPGTPRNAYVGIEVGYTLQMR